MGPGYVRSRNVARSNVSDRVGSVRAGEVPVCYDNTNPRVYRRLVCDWVAFQDLSARDSSKKLTLGQQILAIVTNIRGNAGLRMGHIPSLLSKDMTRADFMKMVDYILDLVDPVDRESAFLQTAKAWQDLMGKVYHRNQSYDKYWTEYSALSVNYAYSHGAAARTSGVQELLALLCVLNAKLSRAEFSIVLQASMKFQKEALQDGSAGLRSSPAPGIIGPASATHAMSHYSDVVGVTAVEATTSTQSDGVMQTVQLQHEIGTGGSSSSSTRMRSKERTQPGVHESLAICAVELAELESRAKEVLEATQSVVNELNGWTVTQPDASTISNVIAGLRTSAGKSAASITALSSTKGVVDALRTRANDNDLSYRIGSTVVPETAPIPGPVVEEPPLITLEAVRMALRRIDHGDLATKSARRLADIETRSTTDGSGAVSATTSLAGKPPDVKCWVCKGAHFYYESANCKKLYEDQRSRRPAKEGNSSKKDSARGQQKNAPFGSTALSSVRWADPPKTALTKMAVNVLESRAPHVSEEQNGIANLDAIVDGGATATVIGLENYVRYCDDHGLEATVSRKRSSDFTSHAFGTEENHSVPQKVVGRCNVPLSLSDDVFIPISCLVVDGDVPLVIGKDTLVMYKCVESHDANWITFNASGKDFRVDTYVSDKDGHSRIIIAGDGLYNNVAKALLQKVSGDKQAPLGIIRRIHRRTHLHPRSIEHLLKRAGKWRKEMAAEISRVQGECKSCMRSGDPPPASKFSMSKIHLNFNERVYIDVMYWGTEMVLHVVDYATFYSELALIPSRELMKMLRVVTNIWILRHGDPVEIIADAEFDRGIARRWAKNLGIKLVALPARRHNKAGPVERKHRVVKDVLERLENDADSAKRPLTDLLAEACFIGNILYGNRTASSFELVRGYTPSVAGTGMMVLPKEARDAHSEMVARRLLAKVLRARPASVSSRKIRIGDEILVLLPGGKRPRGEWVKRKVKSVREDYSVIVGTGRNRCVIAPEDVRTFPKNKMAAAAFRVTMDSDNSDDTAMQSTEADDESDFEEHGHEQSDSSSDDDDEIMQLHPQRTTEGSSFTESPPSHATAVENGNDIGAATRNDAEQNVPIVPASVEVEDSAVEVDDQVDEPVVSLRRSGRAVRPVERLNLLSNPINRDDVAQTVLHRAHLMLGNAQFMSKEMPWIPEWMYEQAQHTELDINWLPNMHRVRCSKVPDGSNIISSHFVYKVKIDEENSCKKKERYILKARLCVHGNRDDERESLRTDAAVVSQNGFRLLYSIALCAGMILGKADIRGAYTQSGIAHRDVYVQPPRDMNLREEIWLLTATMYGLVSAGRKWQRVSDEVLCNDLILSPVWGLPQLFYHGMGQDDCSGRGLCLIVAKYVDDLLVAGRNEEWLQYAHDGVEGVFELSSWTVSPVPLTVNAAEVVQEHNHVTVSMVRYLREVELLKISAQRRKEPESAISWMERKRLKSLAGKLGYLGVTVSPFACFAASFLQQLIPTMTVSGFKKANAIVRDVLKREPILAYLQPSLEEQAVARVVVFSDAGFPHEGTLKRVAQEGCIVGISFGTAAGSIFHTVAYQSRKQRRVATSTGEAETIAAVTAVGCARQLQESYVSVMNQPIDLTLVVDSKGLHRCLATQSTPRDRGMFADVHRLRAEYESGSIADIVWVPGPQNPADALTKPMSGTTSDLLEKMLVSGRLPIAIDNRREYGPALQEEL